MAEYEIEFRCKHCGKPISILHPSQWGYKVRNKKGGWNYFCTWKCLRADERKEPKPVQAEEPEKETKNNRVQVLVELMAAVKDGRDVYDYLQGMGYADPKDTLRRLRITAKKDAPEIYQWMEQNGLLDMRKEHSGKGVDKVSKHKLTREQKEKAVEIAIQGGDPLEYLKKCGAKNPSAAWWYIKKTLAEKNPKLLEQIPEKPGTVLDIEAAANYLKKAEKDFHIIDKPLNYDGFKVTAIDGEFGQYRMDGDKIGFQNQAKIMYFSMHKEDLGAFIKELTRAAQILEVDV